jgi:WD40 repeat protein
VVEESAVELIFSLHTGKPVYDSIINPSDGSIVTVSAIDGAVEFWRINGSGRPERIGLIEWPGERLDITFPADPESLPEVRNGERVHRVVDVAFSPTGDLIALLGPNKPIEVRRWSDLALMAALGERGRYSAVAFDARGTCVAADGWGTEVVEGSSAHAARSSRYSLSLFDLGGTLRGSVSPGGWGKLTRHPTTDLVVSVANDRPGSFIRFVRSGPSPEMSPLVLASEANVEAVSFSPDGRLIALFGQDEGVVTAAVLEFPSLKQRFAHVHASASTPSKFRLRRCGLFDGEGCTLFYPLPGGAIAEVDADAGSLTQQWPAHEGEITSLAWDGTRGSLVTAGVDGWVRGWGERTPRTHAVRQIAEADALPALPSKRVDVDWQSARVFD